MNESLPVIACREVRKSYGNFEALHGVTFEVQRGRVCSLLGPNGAGKSTLVKILAGLLPLTSGSATVSGHDTRRAGHAMQRSLGVVPENLALFNDLTIEEHLFLSGPIYGLDARTTRERTAELLRVLTLEHGRHRFLRDCSHGMRKKTALALALLHNPPVVILDEPFEGIDPISAEAIRRLLRTIAERGTTVLLTAHILPLVTSVADELLLLRRGELVYQSEVKALPSALEDLYFELIEAPPEEALTWLGSVRS